MTEQDPLKSLYEGLHAEKLYTKSYEDFKIKYSNEEAVKGLFDGLSAEKLYTKDYDSFKGKYFPVLGKQTEVSPQGSVVTSQTSVEPTANTVPQNVSSENPNESSLGQSSDFVSKLNQANINKNKLQGLDENVAMQEFAIPEGTTVVDNRLNEYGLPVYAKQNEDGTYSEGGSVLPEATVSISKEEAKRRSGLSQDDLIKGNEPLTLWESTKNSFKNVATQLKGADDRLSIFAADVWSKILGEDLAKSWYEADGRSLEKDLLASYEELDRLGKESLPTLGIVEGFKENDFSSIAGGIVNGITSIFSTAIVSAPTYGAGLITEMVGGGLYDYNSEKAKTKGVSVEELIKNNEADFWTPAVVGAVGAGLEKFGLKGVQKGIMDKLAGPMAKKLAILSLETNKEGMTEWVQTGLEAYSLAKAQGKSESDAIEALSSMMMSEQGLESYLQGISGSAGSVAGGRLVKGVLSKSSRNKIQSSSEQLQSVVSDFQNNNDPDVRSQLLDVAAELSQTIQSEKQKDNELVSNLSPSQKSDIDGVKSELESVENSLSQGNLSEQTVSYLESKKSELENDIETIITTKEPSTELTPEQIDEGVLAQRKANPEIENILMGSVDITDEVYDTLSSVDSKEAVSDTQKQKAIDLLYEKKKELKSLKNDSNRSHTISEIDQAISGIDSDLELLNDYNPTSSIQESDFKTLKPGDKFSEGVVKSSKLNDDGSVSVTMDDGSIIKSEVKNENITESVKESVPTIEVKEPVKLVENEKTIETPVIESKETGPQDQNVATETEQVIETPVEEEKSFSSPEEADLDTLKNTQDPQEVLRIYDRWENTDNSKQSFIANNIGKINASDYASNADKNNLIGNRRLRRWIDSKNGQKQKLDTIAEDMSDRFGQEITVSDILDFISEYDSSKDYFSKASDNNVRIEAGVIYQKLTGRNITDRALEKQRDRDTQESRDNVRKSENKQNMEVIGVTEQEIADRQNMESESDKVAVKKSEKTDGPETQATLLKGVSDRLKATGLANSIKIETSENISVETGRNGADVKGYVDKDGNIVVNKDTATIDSPIHELGHVWTDKMKQSNKPLFDRGMELIQTPEGKAYVDHVRQTQPNLVGDALYEEALVQAIGDSGARLVKTQERSKITEWLKAAWDYIGGLVGISGKTMGEISNMSLREYSDAVAVDLLSGKPIAGLSNGDIIVSDKIIKAESKSGMSVDEKKIADFMERMRNRNTVKFQGNIDGDPSSFSDSELSDFVDLVQSLMRTGQISNYTDLKSFAKSLGIDNEGQVRYAWRVNHPDASIGIQKSLVDAKTVLGANFEKMSDTEYIELGKRLVDQKMIDVNELIVDVIDSGRVLEPYEVTALIYGRSLDEKRIDELYEKRNSKDETSEGKVELESLLEKLNQYDLLILQTANAQSAAFRLRGVLTDKDYNVIHYINAMEKVGHVSPELRSQLEALGKEMEAVKSELRSKVAELEIAKKKHGQRNINKNASKKSTNPNVSRKKQSEIKADALSVFDDININDYGLAGLSFQMGGLRFSVSSNNPLLTAIQDGISSIQNDISNNGKTLSEALESAIDGINNAVGQGKWNELKFRSDVINKFVSKGNSIEAKKPYVGTDGKLVVPTSYLKEIVSDYHKNNGNAEMSVEDIVDTVYKYVGSGFNKREILDAVSRYGVASSNTRSDEIANITKARSIGKLLAELDDLERTHVIKSKKGGNPIDQRVKDLRKAISDLEDSITWTPEQKAQNKENKALDRKIQYMEDYIARIEQKIADKNFEPERKVPVYDFSNHPDIIAIEKKREAIRDKFKAAKYKHELENRSGLEKAFDIGLAVTLNITRGITAGSDLSSYLIQGGLITTSMPGRSTKSLVKSTKISLKEEFYLDYFNELQRDPFFDIARKSTLSMQLPNFYQSIVEEQIGGGNIVTQLYEGGIDKVIGNKELAQKFKDRFPPTVAERQYAVFLSDLRFNLFKEIVMDQINYKGLDVNSEQGKKLMTKIAEGINDVTMASNFNAVKGAPKVQAFLNNAFFSVRKLVANFKLLYKIPYYGLASTVNTFANSKYSGNTEKMRELARKTEVDAMLFNKIYGATAGKGLAVMAASVLIPTLIANAVYDDDEDEDPPMFYNPHILNPIHSDFMKLKIGETRFSPFLGIEGAVVFLARQVAGGYMNTTSNAFREFGEKSGMSFNDTRFDNVVKFFGNKLAPTPSMLMGWAGSEFQQRESNDRVAKSIAPMWVTGAIEEYEANQNLAFAIGTTALSIFGANFSTYGGAEFASKKGTDNEEVRAIMRKAGLTDYTPDFRTKKYGTFEEGSFVKELSKNAMDKTYKPAYNNYMTKAVLVNKSELNSKSTNPETKEGLFNRIKQDGYAYAELKSTGVIVDKSFVTFDHIDSDGNRTKYRLTKSQYKEKVDLINKFKSSKDYNARYIREDVINSLGQDQGSRDADYIKMKVDLKTYREANKWANEQLSDKFTSGKYVKDSEFKEEDDQE